MKSPVTISCCIVVLTDGSTLTLSPQGVTSIDAIGVSSGTLSKLEAEISAEMSKRKERGERIRKGIKLSNGVTTI